MPSTSKNPRKIIPVMTIAGSDCSAGAGLQADLKTFQHFGLHGLTAVTCIVSETANIIRRIDPVDPAMMEDQIRLMLYAFPLTVTKIGMLGTAGHVLRVAEIFRGFKDIALVIDPVMIASTGASLLQRDAVEAYIKELLPLARVITPNLPEAEELLGRRITSLPEMQAATRELASIHGCAVLLKGGHLGEPVCTDFLFDQGRLHSFSSPRLSVAASHGTGCTLSAAVASGLALGKDLADSVAVAKDYLNDCLQSAYSFTSPMGEKLHALNQGTQTSNPKL